MSTVFSFKKAVNYLMGALLLCVYVGCLLFSFQLSKAKRLDVANTFYFLVSNSTHIQASTYETESIGGAGYLLETKEREYATFSVYLSKDKAEQAKAALSERHVPTEMVSVSVGTIWLKTKREKKNAKVYQSAFELLDNFLQVLDGQIVRLTVGETQESVKRVLEILKKQVAYTEKEYEKNFPDFSKLCNRAVKSLEKTLDGIVYAKDLRYLLCELCVGYVQMVGNFSV